MTESQTTGDGHAKLTILVHHREDRAVERLLRHELAALTRPTTVLVVSSDALADRAILPAARDAIHAGTLRLLLWRPCLAEFLDEDTLGYDEQSGAVVAKTPAAPKFYPRNGTSIGPDREGGGAMDRLVKAVAELVDDLRRDGTLA